MVIFFRGGSSFECQSSMRYVLLGMKKLIACIQWGIVVAPVVNTFNVPRFYIPGSGMLEYRSTSHCDKGRNLRVPDPDLQNVPKLYSACEIGFRPSSCLIIQVFTSKQ